jgi:phospholipase/carboxylesterase
VQTLIETELIYFHDWTLRVRSTERPERLLLLLHGYTGDENSMWVFARGLPSRYWMIAPRAPHIAEGGGYTWRPLQRLDPSTGSGQDFGKPTLDQLRAPAEDLLSLVDAYRASAGIDASVFDVMGFSQGAVMSSVLSFLYPQRIRKVGFLAGFVPSELEALAPRHPLEGKPFFVAHGVKDETIPIDRARRSVATLEEAGAQVTYCEDEVGHKVSAGCLSGLKAFFAD